MSTGVSIMMNGVCCVYQMNGERELRQAMRNDIRDEWREQRELETKAKFEQERESERLRLVALEKRYNLLHKDTHTRRPVETQMFASRSAIKASGQRKSSPTGSRGLWSGVSSRDFRCRDHSLLPSLLDEEE